MQTDRYDLCILGAGPGGYAAAMRAHDLGRRVVLIESDRVGGVGIHNGALSSKTMWHLSNDFDTASRLDRGYTAHNIELSYTAVMETVREAVRERRETLEEQLVRLGAAPTSGAGVWLRRGQGRFVSPNEVEIRSAGGGVERIAAEYFLIATGSRPRLPSGIEVDGQYVVTSDHIERWGNFPKSMVIVGAGVIGCEYAAIFARFRRTKIYLIDQQPRILPFEDADVAAVVADNFREMGVTIHHGARLQRLRVVDGTVEYVIADEQRVHDPIYVERALISIGRVPSTAGLGLDAAGVSVGKNGSIVVDGTRTTAPHIHAAGDVTMDVALANVAELEGRHAIEDMFGLKPAPIRYEAITSIMFLAPELAAVGLGEQQAAASKIPYRVAMVSNRLVNRAIAMRSTTGFVKLLAARDSDRVLGLRVVGPQASSTAQGVALLIDREGTLTDIDRCLHPHPAIPEAVQECARLLLGRSVHKPEVFGDALLRTGVG